MFSIFGPSAPGNLVSRVALNLSFASLTTTERNLAFRYFVSSYTYEGHGPQKILLWTPGWEPLG